MACPRGPPKGNSRAEPGRPLKSCCLGILATRRFCGWRTNGTPWSVDDRGPAEATLGSEQHCGFVVHPVEQAGGQVLDAAGGG